MTAASAARLGEITTLYSFKGGVGRTMAAANIAFMAAMNGMRVLVMDWDLEAPGLAYYFRGLPDPDQARAIKSAPGVLDLVWTWRRDLAQATEAIDVDNLLRRYEVGEPFAACVRPVLPPTHTPSRGSLDVLGAGCREIEPGLSYAEALARFSWTEFFDGYAGGLFIERLRNWAKSHYDLVLVDSRTGYADVAGVCTVQLPDAVALTFIYNRQNIEGVASVAATIRRERGDAIRVRAVPMRLSREGTLPEAEARSRAIRSLSRSGAFTEETAKADIERLAVRAAPGVPFYETLAQFASPTATADQLTLDYKRLGEAICGRALEVVDIPEAWRDQVARRLEPKAASIEYVDDLRSADPERAAEELEILLDGALEAELHDDGLDQSYLGLLIEVAMELEDIALGEVPGERIQTIAQKALILAHSEYELDPPRWALTYVDAQERYDSSWGEADDDASRIARLRERERILHVLGEEPAGLLRRASLYFEIAGLQRGPLPKQALLTLHEGLTLLANVDTTLDTPLAASIRVQRAVYWLNIGAIQAAQKDPTAAALSARSGLSEIEENVTSDPRHMRIRAELHLLLARIVPDQDMAAAEFMMVVRSPTFFGVVNTELPRYVDIALRSNNGRSHAIEIVRRIAAAGRDRSGTSNRLYPYFARSAGLAANLLAASTRLLEPFGAEPMPGPRLEDELVRTNVSVLETLRRRVGHWGGAATGRDVVRLSSEVSGLAQAAAASGVAEEIIDSLRRAGAAIETRAAGVGDVSP